MILCAAALMGCGTNTIKPDDRVMEIAGNVVVREEYEMILKRYISEVTRQYTTEDVNKKNFWNTEVEGKYPIEQIMELAKDELVYKKTIAYLAEQAGMEQETEYVPLMTKMHDANNSDGMQYGLTSYEPADYYSYIYKGIEAEVIENLKQKKDVTEEELKAIYQENIASYTSDVRVQMLVAEWKESLGEELASQIAMDMGSGATKEAMTEKYPDVYFYEIELSTLNPQEGKSGVYYQRWLVAEQMQKGEICETFSIGDNLMVMQCLNREENAALEFDTIKNVLESDVRTQLAKEEISAAVEAAEIAFEHEKLQEIALSVLSVK